MALAAHHERRVCCFRAPPDDLLGLTVDISCVFSVDTDAHAPGQLDWLGHGC